jgi:putative alpha-1,2-mannosidase
MSAWAFFNYLGFYPVNPASGQYVIGTPAFEKVTLDLPDRKERLIISAPGAQSKPYIKSLQLDHSTKSIKPIITHEQLMSVREMKFEMSSKPQSWGKNSL